MNNMIIRGDEFKSFSPISIEIEKSVKDGGGYDYDNMIFHGVASDNSKDVDGDTLEPSGYDLSFFKKQGFFNLEHLTKIGKDPYFWVGEPLEAKVKDDKLFVKGKLWKDHPLARSIWETMNVMQKSGSTRKMGMSIEGRAMARDPLNPKRITRSLITNIALTMTPCNPNSWVEMTKSIQAGTFLQKNVDDGNMIGVLKEFDSNGKTYWLLEDLTVIEKTMDVAAVSPLMRESLDKKKHKVLSLSEINKSLNVIKKSIDDGIIDKDVLNMEKIVKNLGF